MTHAVVHFEVSGTDDGQLAEFYAGLFSWHMQAVPGAGYTLVETGAGTGINGGIERITDDAPSTKFYIEADDLQAVLDKVNLLGGKTITPITELPGMATYAIFEDLDGLLIGLVLGPGSAPGASGGDGQQAAPPGAGGQAGAPVDWFEVLGADPVRSQRFYAEVFGWQLSTAAEASYAMVDTGSQRGIRGGIGPGTEGARATVYARVPDVRAALERAAGLGGAREYGPAAVDSTMQTGVLRDPAGNLFGVYSRTSR